MVALNMCTTSLMLAGFFIGLLDYSDAMRMPKQEPMNMQMEPVVVKHIKHEHVTMAPDVVQKMEPVVVKPVALKPVNVKHVKHEHVTMAPVIIPKHTGKNGRHMSKVDIEPLPPMEHMPNQEPVIVKPVNIQPVNIKPLNMEPIHVKHAPKHEPMAPVIIPKQPSANNMGRMSQAEVQVQPLPPMKPVHLDPVNVNVKPLNLQPVNVKPLNMEKVTVAPVIIPKQNFETKMGRKMSRFEPLPPVKKAHVKPLPQYPPHNAVSNYGEKSERKHSNKDKSYNSNVDHENRETQDGENSYQVQYELKTDANGQSHNWNVKV